MDLKKKKNSQKDKESIPDVKGKKKTTYYERRLLSFGYVLKKKNKKPQV